MAQTDGGAGIGSRRMTKRSAEPWRGHLSLGAGWALVDGHAGENARHAHHALQLCVAAEGKLRVELASDEYAASAIAVGADVPHRLVPGEGRVALLYLDPASDAGRRVTGWLRGAAAREFAPPSAIDSDPESLRELMLGSILGSSPDAPSPDSRIELALRRLAAADLRSRPALAALARDAGLSPSRFAARFRASTGIAVRPYVLWLRLQRAVSAMRSGASATEAAHAAGLADSAHLARTFRRMFGTTLSASVARLAPADRRRG